MWSKEIFLIFDFPFRIYFSFDLTRYSHFVFQVLVQTQLTGSKICEIFDNGLRGTEMCKGNPTPSHFRTWLAQRCVSTCRRDSLVDLHYLWADFHGRFHHIIFRCLLCLLSWRLWTQMVILPISLSQKSLQTEVVRLLHLVCKFSTLLIRMTATIDDYSLLLSFYQPF